MSYVTVSSNCVVLIVLFFFYPSALAIFAISIKYNCNQVLRNRIVAQLDLVHM